MLLCDPKILCVKHLGGEYRELFTFVGNLKRQISLDGYFANNCLEPTSIQSRYEELRTELLRRAKLADRTLKPKPLNFNPSLLDYLGPKKFTKIDHDKALHNLLQKCPKCRKRFTEQKQNTSEEKP